MGRWALHSPLLKTRGKLGLVNVCKDLWDGYYRNSEKRRVPSNHPRNTCETHLGSIFLLISKVANGHTSLRFHPETQKLVAI